MKISLSMEGHFRGCIDGEAHWNCRFYSSNGGIDRFSQRTICQLSFNAQNAFRVMLRTSNCITEWFELILALEQLSVVKSHVVGEIHCRYFFSNGSNQLFPQH